MATNKKSRDAYALISVALTLAAVFLANRIADRVYARWDLTEEKRYSLSEPFYNIIRGLQDPLKITYYISESVPADFEVGKRDILDKLNEIKTASGGRIILEVVDPSKDKKMMQELLKEDPGVVFRYPSIEKDRKVLTDFTSAVRLTYQEKPTVLMPRVFSSDGIEYVLGSRIVSLTLKEKPIVAVHFPLPKSGGARQKQEGGSFEWILKTNWALDEKYDKRYTPFAEGNAIPPGTKLLILIRPKNLSDRSRYEITKYLAEGGRVLLVSSPWEIGLDTGLIEKVTTRLEDDIREMGVTWVPAFVCDESNIPLLPRIQQQGNVQFYEMQPHPFFVKIQPFNMDQKSDNPITRLLPSLVMPYTSAFTVNEEKAKAGGFNVETLARTSPRSWTEPLPQFLDMGLGAKAPAKFDNPRPVLLRVTGQFPFAWEGKSPPAWPETEEEEGKKKPKEPAAALTKKEGMLFLFSCPESFHGFFLDQAKNDPQLQQDFRGNVSVLLNVAENCALGDQLVNMRIKRYETRAIKKFEEEGGDTRRNLLKLALIAGVPLLVVAFALAYWYMRRGAQVDYERTFAKTTGPSSFSA
jgi:ABC-type uncharacterized transport system involved in gliding motility auxiliary subunit